MMLVDRYLIDRKSPSYRLKFLIKLLLPRTQEKLEFLNEQYNSGETIWESITSKIRNQRRKWCFLTSKTAVCQLI